MTATRAVTVREARELTALLPDEGLDSLPVIYGKRDGRRFRPSTLSASWRRRDRGEWLLTSVSVAGPIVKKDGTDGQATGALQLTRPMLHGNGEWREDAPQWARALVAAWAPEGVSA